MKPRSIRIGHHKAASYFEKTSNVLRSSLAPSVFFPLTFDYDPIYTTKILMLTLAVVKSQRQNFNKTFPS